MKPRYRPGKVVVPSRAERAKQLSAKELSESQIEHLKRKTAESGNQRMGRGGRRAHWDTDYEEGCKMASRPMPNRDTISQDGIRRFPKKH